MRALRFASNSRFVQYRFHFRWHLLLFILRKASECYGGVQLSIATLAGSGERGAKWYLRISIPQNLLCHRHQYTCSCFRSSLIQPASSLPFQGKDTAALHHYVAGEDETLYVGAAQEEGERDFDGFAAAFTDVRVSALACTRCAWVCGCAGQSCLLCGTHTRARARCLPCLDALCIFWCCASINTKA